MVAHKDAEESLASSDEEEHDCSPREEDASDMDDGESEDERCSPEEGTRDQSDFEWVPSCPRSGHRICFRGPADTRGAQAKHARPHKLVVLRVRCPRGTRLDRVQCCGVRDTQGESWRTTDILRVNLLDILFLVPLKLCGARESSQRMEV